MIRPLGTSELFSNYVHQFQRAEIIEKSFRAGFLDLVQLAVLWVGNHPAGHALGAG